MKVPHRFTQVGSKFEGIRLPVPLEMQKLIWGRKIFVPILDAPGHKGFTAEPIATKQIKFSLRTTSAELAAKRRLHVIDFFEIYCDAVRQGIVPLTNRNIAELAGDVYRKLIEINSENPGSVDIWQCVKAWNRAVLEGRVTNPPGLDIFGGPKEDEKTAKVVFGVDLTAGVDALTPGVDNRDAMEQRFGDAATWILSEKKIEIDVETRQRLLIAVQQAVTHAAVQLKKNATFDYSPDPNADRYPLADNKREAVTLRAMYNKWLTDVDDKADSSINNLKKIVERFEKFFGKEKDIRDVETADASNWKDWLRTVKTAKGKLMENRTINDSYMVMTRTLFRIAIRSGLRKDNPFDGLRVKVRRLDKLKMNPYSDEQIVKLLEFADQETDLTKKWIARLVVCTGARPGEIAQLSKRRVHIDAEIPYIDIDEAEDGGSTKTEFSPRDIPIHPYLFAKGFKEFIEARPDGPIFYDAGKSKSVRHPSKYVVQQLSRWVRSGGFEGERIAPVYGVRHWWRTTMGAIVNLGVPVDVVDYIFAHQTGKMRSRYEGFDLHHTKPVIEMLKIPGSN